MYAQNCHSAPAGCILFGQWSLTFLRSRLHFLVEYVACATRLINKINSAPSAILTHCLFWKMIPRLTSTAFDWSIQMALRDTRNIPFSLSCTYPFISSHTKSREARRKVSCCINLPQNIFVCMLIYKIILIPIKPGLPMGGCRGRKLRSWS